MPPEKTKTPTYKAPSYKNRKSREEAFQAEYHDEASEALEGYKRQQIASYRSLGATAVTFYEARKTLIDNQAKALGISPRAAAVICTVETGGVGSVNLGTKSKPDERMRVRLEPHIVKKGLERKYKGNDLDEKLKQFSAKFRSKGSYRWDFYSPKRNAWVSLDEYSPGRAGYYRRMYDALDVAATIDSELAYGATSFGLPQVLGSNYAGLNKALRDEQGEPISEEEKFKSAQDMFEKLRDSESLQVRTFFAYIGMRKLERHLKEGAENWAAVAPYYNGPRYWENEYDWRMEGAASGFGGGSEKKELVHPTKKSEAPGAIGKGALQFSTEISKSHLSAAIVQAPPVQNLQCKADTGGLGSAATAFAGEILGKLGQGDPKIGVRRILSSVQSVTTGFEWVREAQKWLFPKFKHLSWIDKLGPLSTAIDIYNLFYDPPAFWGTPEEIEENVDASFRLYSGLMPVLKGTWIAPIVKRVLRMLHPVARVLSLGGSLLTPLGGGITQVGTEIAAAGALFALPPVVTLGASIAAFGATTALVGGAMTVAAYVFDPSLVVHIWDKVKEFAPKAWDWTKDKAATGGWIAEKAGQTWSWTKKTTTSAANWASEKAQAGWQWTKETAREGAHWVSEKAQQGWERTKEAVGGGVRWATGKVQQGEQWAKGITGSQVEVWVESLIEAMELVASIGSIVGGLMTVGGAVLALTPLAPFGVAMAAVGAPIGIVSLNIGAVAMAARSLYGVYVASKVARGQAQPEEAYHHAAKAAMGLVDITINKIGSVSETAHLMAKGGKLSEVKDLRNLLLVNTLSDKLNKLLRLNLGRLVTTIQLSKLSAGLLKGLHLLSELHGIVSGVSGVVEFVRKRYKEISAVFDSVKSAGKVAWNAAGKGAAFVNRQIAASAHGVANLATKGAHNVAGFANRIANKGIGLWQAAKEEAPGAFTRAKEFGGGLLQRGFSFAKGHFAKSEEPSCTPTKADWTAKLTLPLPILAPLKLFYRTFSTSKVMERIREMGSIERLQEFLRKRSLPLLPAAALMAAPVPPPPTPGKPTPKVEQSAPKPGFFSRWFKVQRSGDGSDPIVDAGALRGGLIEQEGVGRPLESGLRRTLSRDLGFDPEAARLHLGPASAKAARTLGAEAFTVGHDVFFGEGRFDPHSPKGLGLIAHELTHVGQQTGTTGDSARFYSSRGGDEMEREAQLVESRVVAKSGSTQLQIGTFDRVFEVNDTDSLSSSERKRLLDCTDEALRFASSLLEQEGILHAHLGELVLDAELELGLESDADVARRWGSAIADAVLAQRKLEDAGVQTQSLTRQMKQLDEVPEPVENLSETIIWEGLRHGVVMLLPHPQEKLASVGPSAKIELIRAVTDGKVLVHESNGYPMPADVSLTELWASFGTSAEQVARSEIDLFLKSIGLGLMVWRLAGSDKITEKFDKDLRSLMSRSLQGNDRTFAAEQDKLGLGPTLSAPGHKNKYEESPYFQDIDRRTTVIAGIHNRIKKKQEELRSILQTDILPNNPFDPQDTRYLAATNNGDAGWASRRDKWQSLKSQHDTLTQQIAEFTSEMDLVTAGNPSARAMLRSQRYVGWNELKPAEKKGLLESVLAEGRSTIAGIMDSVRGGKASIAEYGELHRRLLGGQEKPGDTDWTDLYLHGIAKGYVAEQKRMRAAAENAVDFTLTIAPFVPSLRVPTMFAEPLWAGLKSFRRFAKNDTFDSMRQISIDEDSDIVSDSEVKDAKDDLSDNLLGDVLDMASIVHAIPSGLSGSEMGKVRDVMGSGRKTTLGIHHKTKSPKLDLGQAVDGASQINSTGSGIDEASKVMDGKPITVRGREITKGKGSKTDKQKADEAVEESRKATTRRTVVEAMIAKSSEMLRLASQLQKSADAKQNANAANPDPTWESEQAESERLHREAYALLAIAQKIEGKSAVVTPHGIKRQEASKAATRNAIEKKLQAGGKVKIYKLGVSGEKEALESQFWMLEDPRQKLDKYRADPKVGAKYAIPGSNPKAARAFDFVLEGELKPGEPFVTKAPDEQPGLRPSANAVEVVVAPSAVTGIRYHSLATPDGGDWTPDSEQLYQQQRSGGAMPDFEN